MITQLSGKQLEVQPSHVVIDCGGVGYWVNISLNTFEEIKNNQTVLLFTHLSIRDDAHVLYGFHHKNERTLFLKLISVNGVGPTSAMMMLSTLTIQEIQSAIQNGNAKQLQSVKGIGLKTAQRIIVDLKDKLEIPDDWIENSLNQENKTKTEALSALEVLGISKKIAEKKMEAILLEMPDISVELLVKETLKKI